MLLAELITRLRYTLLVAVVSFSGSTAFAQKAERADTTWVRVSGARAGFDECRRLLAEDTLPTQGRGKATYGEVTYGFTEKEQLHWLRTDLTAPYEGKTVHWPFGCIADADGRVTVFIGWEFYFTGQELY